MKLFETVHFSEFALGLRERVRAEVAAEPADRLLGMDEAEYLAYLESKYRLEPIRFHMDQKLASAQEVRIPARRFPPGFYVAEGESYPKQVITIHVPFSGDEQLFRVRPSQWLMRTFEAGQTAGKIAFDVIDFWAQGDHLKEAINSACTFLEQQAGNLASDVGGWNGNLKSLVHQLVQAQKKECLQRKQALSAIGIPLLSNGAVPATFAVPVQAKRIEVPKPSSAPGAFRPDPTMDEADFAKIVSILSDTGQAFERTPAVHTTQSEEGIRDHLLMVLSTHYKNASGETFRVRGKTDLLVPHEDGALFVAEVKVWSGPKSFVGAIDQLLSYLTWRDSKAALIMLVRQSGFSEIVSQVPALAQGHARWSSVISEDGPTARFVYRMSLPSDQSRKIRLAVLLFHLADVPLKRTQRKGRKGSQAQEAAS